MHKFSPPLCPQNICPVSVGDAPLFVLLKYIELNPFICVFVKLVATAWRLPETAKLSHVVVPVKVGSNKGAFVVSTSAFE